MEILVILCCLYLLLPLNLFSIVISVWWVFMWPYVGAYGWVVRIASHGSILLFRSLLILVEAPGHPMPPSSKQLDPVVKSAIPGLRINLCSSILIEQTLSGHLFLVTQKTYRELNLSFLMEWVSPVYSNAHSISCKISLKFKLKIFCRCLIVIYTPALCRLWYRIQGCRFYLNKQPELCKKISPFESQPSHIVDWKSM